MFIKIYATVFLLFVVSNLGYMFYLRCRPWLIVYDLASGLYLVFLIVAYWHVPIRNSMPLYHIPLYIGVMAIEFYMSVWWKGEDFGPKTPEMAKEDLEFAKALSLVFSAPAYVIGGLLCFDIAARFLGLKT